MSLFSTNRCKTLSAEYVEESYKAVNEAPDVSEPGDASAVVSEAPDVSEPNDATVNEAAPDVSKPGDASSVVNEAPDVSEADDLFIDEAIDALLESLNDEE